MRRIIIGLALILVPAMALAQSSEEPGIDILDVSGPLDASALGFISDSIEAAADSGQELVVIQVNSRAVLDVEAFDHLRHLLDSPPLPTAIWVGPAPAYAYGGAARLVLESEVAAIAPGSSIGLILPTIAGDSPGSLEDSYLEPYKRVVDAEQADLELQPTIRQFVQDLNGRTFPTSNGPVVAETITEFVQDGETGVTNKTVTFLEPSLGTRFFRLAVNPEAAFFFLVVGLSVISFEFFAIGPGVAAAFGGISVFLGGWGMVNLPTRWWAVGLALAGWALLTASYQRGGVLAFTVVGAVMLQVGGTFLIDGSGQIDPRWWLVLPSVLAVLFFFLMAMPVVQRARFSTQVLGRASLIGAVGSSLVAFDPDGIVEVNGARWRATAHREAGIGQGTEIAVTGVDGLFLEVEPVRSDREN